MITYVELTLEYVNKNASGLFSTQIHNVFYRKIHQIFSIIFFRFCRHFKWWHFKWCDIITSDDYYLPVASSLMTCLVGRCELCRLALLGFFPSERSAEIVRFNRVCATRLIGLASDLGLDAFAQLTTLNILAFIDTNAQRREWLSLILDDSSTCFNRRLKDR